MIVLRQGAESDFPDRNMGSYCRDGARGLKSTAEGVGTSARS